MKKYLFSLTAILFFGIISQAKHISTITAKTVAENFFRVQSDNLNYTITDIYTESFNNVTTFYVFSFSPKGFVIVSADDIVKPILGYSFTGRFDKNNVPSQVKVCLNQYSGNIYNLIKLKQSNSANSKIWEQILTGEYQSAKYIVTPLCNTTWDQTCWYNEQCPSDTLGPCGHAVTGCVATAIAQVMKFWNYPVQGQGTHSYNSYWYGNLSANFGTTTYDWASMPANVTSTNPAVATLMYHCGVSVDMDYYATSSGSNLYYAINALPAYFKYSNNIEFVYKLNYTDSLWIELLKYELDAGRPVLYQGMLDSIPSGHAWVCDGYDSNNFFHFIWGQGAGYEGYYEMGNLIWNSSNEAVIKIMPVVTCDIALNSFISPSSATFISPSVIKVRISNYDTLAVNNVPVSYVVDGGIPVNEILSTPVAGLSDTVYEFIQPYDFSPNPGHIYNVKVFSTLSCDGYKDNDTISVSVENVACVNPPYSLGFEPAENQNGWIIQDVNNDGNKWNTGPGGNTQPTCIYYNGGSTQANDWLISKCLQLDINKVYKLSYYYKTTGTYYPQKLSVFIGNLQNVSNLTTLLASYNNITNTEYQKTEIYFTVPVQGSYYIGWFCHSDPDNFTFALDDINLSEQAAFDVGLISTDLPVESCNLQQENISVVIRNFCSSIINNIPVSYTLNGGAPVTETITTPIGIGDTLVYTFSTPVDLSANGIYNITMYTSYAGDTLFNNDTLNVNVTNHVSITPYFTMGFEPAEDFSGWKIYNINNDNYKWNIISSGGRSQPYCIRYDYSSWLPADDWFVSSCINLYSLQAYKLSFWYKAEASPWPEKLKVFIGNGQDTSYLTTQLLDFPNIVNTSYQYAEIIFTVPSDNLYYLGWYCYSDAVMFNLYVDDILIDMTTNEQANNLNNEFHIFPNPFKNVLNIEKSNTSKNEIKYEIINTCGKQITQVFSGNNKVSISTNNLNKGVYILKISSDQGIVVKKIVKQ